MNIQPVWFAGLIGALSPIFTRMLTGSRLGRRWKSLIALAVSAVIGFLSAYLSGQFTAATVLQSIAVSFSAAQLVYDQLFKTLLK